MPIIQLFTIPRMALAPETTLANGAAALLEGCAPQSLNYVNWPQEYPEKPEVTLRLGHTNNALWLRFDVREERVRALATEPQGPVYNDSCVEFFVSFDHIAYYNLEMSCIGIPLLGYGKGRACRRAVAPERVRELAISSSLGTEPFAEKSGGFEWTLTARVPIACFEFDKLEHLAGRTATANAYKCNSGLSVKHYLSWCPINTPAPDFHCPEFFQPISFA